MNTKQGRQPVLRVKVNRASSAQHLSVPSQNLQQQHWSKGKALMCARFNSLFQQIAPFIGEEERRRLLDKMKGSQLKSLQTFIQPFFSCYDHCFEVLVKRKGGEVCGQDQRLRKKMLLSPSELRGRPVEELQRENHALKTELNRLKEGSIDLQKRLLYLMNQHKQRKTVYTEEIKRLAAIVTTSIESIPELLLLPGNAPPSRAYSAQKMVTPPPFLKKKSQYNTLSNANQLLGREVPSIFSNRGGALGRSTIHESRQL